MYRILFLFSIFSCLMCIVAFDREYPGYYHFHEISMNYASAFPGTYNFYVTPGDGAQPLGNDKTEADLDLAKHLCDTYDSCLWFNGDQGYPGAIGWWNNDPTQDTYIRNITGDVVDGSTYFNTKYLHVAGVNTECNQIAGPWKLPPDQIHQQCEQMASCQGFTIMNDLSSGFLCQFNSGGDESFIKLP